MRRAAILVLVILAVPNVAGLFRATTEVWDEPPSDAPGLVPPNPAAGPWPPHVRSEAPPHPPRPSQTTGVARVLVLLIRFTDVAQAPAHDGTYYSNRLNADGGSAASLRSYYREVSRGALTLDVTIVSTWWMSAQTMAYYGNETGGGVDNTNGPIYRLTTEAVRAADPTVNFAPFDTNADGDVDHLIVVHAGDGQETDPSNSNLIWSHHWSVVDADSAVPGNQPLTVDGVRVYDYMMVAEDAILGVVAHEFGHSLGLPDLYDTDGSSEGIGLWDLMAGGSWNGAPAGSSPAHPSAWSLLRLGWVTPTDVTTSLVGTPIDAVESSGQVFRLRVPGSADEYFLVENRQPVGTDAFLPGSGLLIWHVDDSLVTSTNPNDADSHRLVDLLEADESVSGDRPTEPTDAWRDSAAGWGPDSRPDSRTYGGAATGWRIRDISASQARMTATIARQITKDLAISAIRLPFAAAYGATIQVQVDVRNEGLQAADITLRVDVYRDTMNPADRVASQTFSRPGVPPETTVNSTLNFTAATAGRYLVHSTIVRSDDEIRGNDERVAHVLVNDFRFRDSVESGVGGWTTNGQSNDLHRWRIVNETDVGGAAHSRRSAWRFGYVETLLPNLFPPEWHTLTSTAIGVSPGSTFLILYHRYDLTRRSLLLPIGGNDSDEARVEVRFGNGPWAPLARFTGRDLAWRALSFNLTGNVTVPTTLQVRFNASSKVMGDSGGWWIDDVMVASLGLRRAAVWLGPTGVLEGPAGGALPLDVKLANVGEYETDFRLDSVLPSGWNATLEGALSGILRGRVVRLAPDNDTALSIRVRIPGDASPGATYPVMISTTAVEDPAAGASVTVQIRVAPAFPLELIIAAVLVAAALIVAIVAVVRRRRPRP